MIHAIGLLLLFGLIILVTSATFLKKPIEDGETAG